MKKIISIILISIMAISIFSGCGKNQNNVVTQQPEKTVAGTLYDHFMEVAKEEESALAIAEKLITNDIIEFNGAAMSVEEGLLTGFGETEILGFTEGAMFAPMISTIPFVGYVFTLDGTVEMDVFKSSLKATADKRWNICTEAEELVVGDYGNKVFFIMCPSSFEEPEIEENNDAEDLSSDGLPAFNGTELENVEQNSSDVTSTNTAGTNNINDSSNVDTSTTTGASAGGVVGTGMSGTIENVSETSTSTTIED